MSLRVEISGATKSVRTCLTRLFMDALTTAGVMNVTVHNGEDDPNDLDEAIAARNLFDLQQEIEIWTNYVNREPSSVSPNAKRRVELRKAYPSGPKFWRADGAAVMMRSEAGDNVKCVCAADTAADADQAVEILNWEFAEKQARKVSDSTIRTLLDIVSNAEAPEMRKAAISVLRGVFLGDRTYPAIMDPLLSPPDRKCPKCGTKLLVAIQITGYSS